MKSLRFVALFLILSLAWTLYAGVPVDARRNYAARGVILQEENGILLLTTTPCAGDAYKQVLRFSMPYQKNPANPIT